MDNKRTILLPIIATAFLAAVFLVWLLADLSQNKDYVVDSLKAVPKEESGDNQSIGAFLVQATEPNSDPFITPARQVYSSLVRSNDPVRGSDEAELTIMEFGDFQCPYCRYLQGSLNRIIFEYSDRLKLVWKDFPNPSHSQAQSAALAAHCAGDEGKFWQYHDYLFENQEELSRELYNQIALKLDLDLAIFNSCLDSKEKAEVVGQGLTDGQELGVDATPYLFIGDSLFDYAPSEAELRSIIERELARSINQ